MELRFQAFPKLNIFLFCGARRKDSFHEIVSLFQKTSSFYDDIILNYEESPCSSVTVRGLEEYVAESESSVYKVCVEWLKKTKHSARIHLDIKKGIPVKSGLGGGSADAGAVLLALERCTGNRTKLSSLVKIGLSAGSDVPFFLYDCDAAIVSGRGEIVKPIEVRNDIEFDVFPGPEPKESTEKAFARLDAIKKSSVLPTAADLVYAYRENPKLWVNTNDFECLYHKPSPEAFLTGSGNFWFTIRIIK